MLLAVGSGRRSRGYGRVLASLLPHVSRAFDTVHFTIDVEDARDGAAWRVEPNRVPGDLAGGEQMSGVLARHRPAVVWICHDWWVWQRLAPALRACTPRPRVVVYSPVAGAMLDPADLDGLSLLVAYTDHARRDLARALGNRTSPSLDRVPHGVDTATFHPLGAVSTAEQARAVRRRARARAFPDRPELADAFVVLNANRNTPRKRLDLTIEGFTRFARGRPDAFLVLHAGRVDQGVDVVDAARSAGIAERVVTTTDGWKHPAVDDRALNDLYNAADIGLNTATSEGWGLTALEHAATGAAQVMTDLETLREIWDEAADFVARRPGERGAREPDPAAVAAALTALHRSRDRLRRRSAAARERACRPAWSWAAVADRWLELLQPRAL